MLSAGDLPVQKGFDHDSPDGDGRGKHDFGGGSSRKPADCQEQMSCGRKHQPRKNQRMDSHDGQGKQRL